MRDNTLILYNQIINQVNDAGGFLTIRHLFYKLVSAGVIQKTEQAYHKVIYHTCQMRKQGYLPYSVFADNTRLVRKADSYDSLTEALEFWSQSYRRELWTKQAVYVELWSEKDAISNIIYGIADEYNVPLMINRGFGSLTFLYNAAETIKRQNKKGKFAIIYYLGDHDPSGVKASNDVEKKLTGFGCIFRFEKLAVNPDQIQEFNLPTRPTKKSNHSKGFEGESVEIDALDPKFLQKLVRDAIESNINVKELNNVRNAEFLEKETLTKITNNMRHTS